MTSTDQENLSVASQDSLAQQYVVQSGDSLAKIAEVYYGSQEHWNKVYQANLALIGPNPHEIEVGMVLSIPSA